jgi:REP element-mobilizing transposase RayT
MGAPWPCQGENEKSPTALINDAPRFSPVCITILATKPPHENNIPAQKHPSPTRSVRWHRLVFRHLLLRRQKKIFLEPTRAQWFLDNLRSDALSHHALAIHAYCIMPDHVHLLSQGLTPTSDLLRFLTDLKRQTGFAYKQESRRQLWQKKSYDHALRSSDPPDLVAWYIWMNPVRAGLCIGVNDYFRSGSLTGAGPRSAPPHESWSPPWRSRGAPI